MPRSTFFVQECPTCGRNLQVRVEHLGKRVVCQHCQARFEASDSAIGGGPSHSGLALLRRAEELLQRVDSARTQSHSLQGNSVQTTSVHNAAAQN